jgi:hypothetical protein
MAPPQIREDLIAFSRHLDNYLPVFRSIQSQIVDRYQFDLLCEDCDNIFELESTQVRCGNETREVSFSTFGCIIDQKFYWANHMNRQLREYILGQDSVGEQRSWNANLAPLFESTCPETYSTHTIPYLVSLVYSPEQNVVFRSRDNVQIFALVDIALDSDPYIGASFSPAPLLRSNRE